MRSRTKTLKPAPEPGMITATSVQARDANRMSVFVDGTFSFGMPVEAAVEMGIRKGLELDRGLLDRCLAADEAYRARRKALGLLAFRQRSEFELRQRLGQAGFGPEAVGSAVARMRDLDYLNDLQFAQAFARDGLRVRKHGARRVLAGLRAKGIPTEVAERVLAELAGEHDETEDAYALAVKKWRTARPGEDPRKVRQRVYGFLGRRGFGAETIHQVLGRLEAESDGVPGPDRPVAFGSSSEHDSQPAAGTEAPDSP